MDSPKLSILIPHKEDRYALLKGILGRLIDQRNELGANLTVEILVNADDLTIGEKRNKLLKIAEGDYVCFIDDDDDISDDYIKLLLEGINKNVDCCSLRGVITFDGETPEVFEHSIKYKEYKTTDNDIMYERYPNHLNCIKSSIAKQFSFLAINHGEDTDWATQIFNSGLLVHEHFIDKVIYHYKYITNK